MAQPGEGECIPLTLSNATAAQMGYSDSWHRSKQPRGTPTCPGLWFKSSLSAGSLPHLLFCFHGPILYLSTSQNAFVLPSHAPNPPKQPSQVGAYLLGPGLDPAGAGWCILEYLQKCLMASLQRWKASSRDLCQPRVQSGLCLRFVKNSHPAYIPQILFWKKNYLKESGVQILATSFKKDVTTSRCPSPLSFFIRSQPFFLDTYSKAFFQWRSISSTTECWLSYCWSVP